MQIRKKSRRLYFIIAALLLALGVALGGYVWYSSANNTPGNTDHTLGKEDGKSTDTQSEPKSDLPSKTPPKDTDDESEIADPTGGSEDTPTKPIETPHIERASQSGSQVKIVASFQKASDGKCEAALQKNSSQIKRTASIVLGPAYYTCAFSIPASSFPSDGTWELTLSHTRGSSVSSAEIQEIQVKR